ncbi:hypothetical protein ACLOJK_035936 [Asimina triloba]
MSENPFQAIFKTCESLSLCLQSHLSRFINSYALQPRDQPRPHLLTNPTPPLFSFSPISPQLQPKREDETQERNSKHVISPLKVSFAFSSSFSISYFLTTFWRFPLWRVLTQR